MIFSKCCNRGLYCPFYFHNDCDILDVFSCRSFHVFKDFPGFKPAATQKVSNSLQHKTALIHLYILILLIKCSMGIYILGKFWNVILSLSSRHYCRIFSLSTGDTIVTISRENDSDCESPGITTFCMFSNIFMNKTKNDSWFVVHRYIIWTYVYYRCMFLHFLMCVYINLYIIMHCLIVYFTYFYYTKNRILFR